MENEGLSQLIQLFMQLGTDAKWAFLAYLGFRVFVVVAIAGTVLTLAWWIIGALSRADEDADAIRQLSDAFGLSWYERSRLIEEVLALKNKRA
jgi:hypothetical protein